MVKRPALVASLLLVCVSAANAAAPDRWVVDSVFNGDNDGQHERSVLAGYVHPLPDLGSTASFGFRTGYWLLDDPSHHSEFGAVRLDYQRDLGSKTQLDLHVLQLASGDWSPTLGSADISYHATRLWSLEGSADYNFVDTALAAQRHTLVNTYNLSTDFKLLDSVTLVGGVLQQYFSDGNHRTGGMARVVYAPAWLEGFNAQLRVRRLDAEFTGIGYFSPAKLEETLAQLQYGHALPGGKWVLTGVLGGGAQRVDGYATSAIYQAELRARGWFTERLGLEGKAGCTNTGGLQVQAASEGYRYCFGNLSLIATW